MIRPATTEDSHHIAKLIYEIWEGMELPLLRAYPKATVQTGLSLAVSDSFNKFSHRNILVKADEEGRAVGIVICYDGAAESELHERLLAILHASFLDMPLEMEQETQPGEWYIDALCVDQEFRGMGWGTQLLAAAEQWGAGQGHSRISLNVERDNGGARRLYESLGYEETGGLTLVGHEYAHMIKKVGKGSSEG
ncbi:GNAT family N-acetyltransferase [Paenibacillus sp. SYP-B4298]|uniref:GNAT family N-acetyltransferase n=1 Tax=Paenibacillus sp. SYP-B4298 TaxID=2996034 RepID=UPI0022DD9056|nr:GNAT family N-acetyltransferase [Paenibacillus sp. SYP-B4298]